MSQNAGAVIVAAGSSSRMAGVDKLYVSVAGRPLLAHTLASFESCPSVDSVVLVVAAAALERARELTRQLGLVKLAAIVPGGARRQDSVALGLAHLPPCRYVVVHDGARPLVTPAIIRRGLELVAETGAASAGVPVVDTIKQVDAEGEVAKTLPRERLWSIQTPQVFDRELLERAHREVPDDVTDDASMVERIGGRVRVYFGAYENLKVTTPPDLTLFEALLSRRALEAAP